MNPSVLNRVIKKHFAAALAAFGLLAFIPAAMASGQQLYTCGMHPQVIKTEPGDCPICHMKLTPLLSGASAGAAGQGGAGGAGNAAAAAALSTIQVDPGIIQRMNLRTQPVALEAAQRQIRTVGIVAFDERTRFDITTRYDGWIEKLYVNAAWQRVKAGEPLFEIYSPTLYNAQLNYLVALRSEGQGGGTLTDAALERLHLLGVTDAFIGELRASGNAVRNYIYRAPADGVVTERFVTQGQMITPGQPIYAFAGLAQVWVEAQVYEKDFGLVKAGQPVLVTPTYGHERVTLEGKVAEILPQIQEATRSAIARIVMENPDEVLLPGMFTDVRFVVSLGDSAVLVPDEAVLRSGEKNTVFVALEGGRFEPREVVLGARTDDYRYVVKSGLDGSETVVVSGQFMLDSESRLREAIQKMINAASGGADASVDAATLHAAMGHSHGGSASGAGKPAVASSAKTGTAAHAEHAAPAAAPAAKSGAAAPAAHDHAAHSKTGSEHDNCSHGVGSACCSTGVGAAAPTAAGTAPAADSCCGGSAASAGAAANGSAVLAASAVSAEQARARRDQMLRPPLAVLAFSAADASSALAADDLAAYRKQLPALRQALQTYFAQDASAASGALAAFAGGGALADPANLKTAREAFAPFSNALTVAVEKAHLNHSGLIHIFECPMVPKVGTGRWLQRSDADAYNPFFGAEMLHCGGIVQ